MTLFITLFVGVQLSLGFLALIKIVRNAPEGYEDETGFHLVRSGQGAHRIVHASISSARTPVLYLKVAPVN